MSWQNKTIGQGINWAREKKNTDRHKGEKQIPKRVPVLDCPVSCETPSRCLILCQTHRSGAGQGQRVEPNSPIEEDLCQLEKFMACFHTWWPMVHFHNLNTLLQVSGCFLPLPWWTNKAKQSNEKWINKYFRELLPPKDSDRINQSVVNSVHKNRTGNLKEHESTCSSSLAAGNTGLVFLRALLTKLGEKKRASPRKS